LAVLTLEDCRVRRGEDLLFDPSWGVFDLAVGETVAACRAGASDPAYYPPTEFGTAKVPRPKNSDAAAEEARVLGLYRDALRIWEKADRVDLAKELAGIEKALDAHRDEWLLRWNLLECLRKHETGEELTRTLRDELLAIEATDPESLPITTGLRYLGVA
jgi:phenylalanine-4-hydroxylase